MTSSLRSRLLGCGLGCGLTFVAAADPVEATFEPLDVGQVPLRAEPTRSATCQPSVVPSVLLTSLEASERQELALGDGDVEAVQVQRGLPLTPPLAAVHYTLRCDEETSSHILDVRHSGERHYLFTHVTHFSVAPDGQRVFLAGFVANGDGRWQPSSRIVHLARQQKHLLPFLPCTRTGSAWSGRKLVTWGREEPNAQVCVWSDTGDLEHRFRVAGLGDGSTLDATIDGDWLWVRNTEQCRAYGQSLVEPDRTQTRAVEQPPCADASQGP